MAERAETAERGSRLRRSRPGRHQAGTTAELSSGPTLQVEDLNVRFPTDDGVVHAVRGVSYELEPGEVLGIVGESGSGKSVTSLAVMGLLPKTARVTGSIRFRGRELIGLGDKQLSTVRGRSIAMVFQDPMTSLNPVYKIGRQLMETLRAHQPGISSSAARRRAIELLDLVGIPNASGRVDQYPHEFSGGMRQRVVIAIAMANAPDVIIADEPTTALDVTVQAQVLETLKTAQAETNASMVLITHDLGVVAGVADKVLVMYAGRPVELGVVDDIYYRPRMPYTVGLLGSMPRVDRGAKRRLRPIPGSPPSLLNLPDGCPFTPRCPMSRSVCETDEPELVAVEGSGHVAACHFSGELEGKTEETVEQIFGSASVSDAGLGANPIAEGGADAAARGRGRAVTSLTKAEESREDVVLRVRDLEKYFPIRSRGLFPRHVGDVKAVDGISFDLHRNETLGLVGESGCGKSTTGRALLHLQPATSGSVQFDGRELTGLRQRTMRPLRRDIQIVFQDPYASLDPRMPVNSIIGEAMHIHHTWDSQRGPARDAELLTLVGLSPEHGNRFPHEFSGGQRQRIGIARALALEPKVLVLDEPVSALDVSIQAGVINLLEDIKDRLGLSYIFIAHDLSVVRHISDRVAVMYLGKIVELADTDELFDSPAHPYTQSLLSAIPLPDPARERERERIIISGDVPSPANPPSGCRFRTRCPKFADQLSDTQRQLCIDTEPELTPRDVGHDTACHYAGPLEIL